MDPSHLHLHVADVPAAAAFYATWFDLREKVRHGDILFLGSPGGFDLALAPGSGRDAMPDWFHLGFRLGSRQAVLDLHRRMTRAGVPIRKDLYADDTFASFRCADPGGNAIEVYWE